MQLSGDDTTATVVSGPNTSYVWLDVLDNLADVLHGLAPAFLAIVLLSRDPGGVGFGIGLDTRRLRSDLIAGIGLYAKHCAICHGTAKADASITPLAKGLYMRPPQLATDGVEDDPEGYTF